MRKGIVRKVASFGIAMAMMTTVFSGCSKAATAPSSVPEKPVEPPAISEQVKTEDVYLEINIANVLQEATKIAGTTLYDGVNITGKRLAGLDLYTEAGSDTMFFFDGDKHHEVDVNGSVVTLEPGTFVFDREGFNTKFTLKVGDEAKREYLEAVMDTFQRKDQGFKEPTLVYEGIDFKDIVGTNRMVKKIDGGYYVNLVRFAKFMGMRFVDVDEYQKAVDELFEPQDFGRAYLLGFDDEVALAVGVNTNYAEICTDEVVKHLDALEQVASQDKRLHVNYLNRLNVGEKETIKEGKILWMPVEYLTSVFGIEYTEDKNVVELVGGHLLPKTVLVSEVCNLDGERNHYLNVSDGREALEDAFREMEGEGETGVGAGEAEVGEGTGEAEKPAEKPVESKPAEKPAPPEVKLPEKPAEKPEESDQGGHAEVEHPVENWQPGPGEGGKGDTLEDLINNPYLPPGGFVNTEKDNGEKQGGVRDF